MGEPDRRRRMVPAEIDPGDARPALGQRDGRLADRGFCDREDAARTQDRRPAHPRLALMLGIAGDDPGTLRLGNMLGVLDYHVRVMPVGRWLHQESPHHLGHPQERREGQPHHAAGGVGAGQALEIDVERRLLVVP